MAARKFGGRYSPDAAGPETARQTSYAERPARGADGGTRLLYMAALPMLIAGILELFAGDPLAMAIELGVFLLMVGGSAMINEGLRAEVAFHARRVAKPPAIPRKIGGAVAIGLGVGLGAAFGWGLGPVSGAGFGLVALAAALLGFGIDPLVPKGAAGARGRDGKRAAEAVARAEAMVAEMTEAVAALGDRALEGRIARFGAAARDMFRAVEEDPRDLARARKFLGVYLSGARDATLKFADLYHQTRDEKARTDYEALLKDLERSFESHRAELLSDNRSALDVEIEVLRRRLRQEGLA